MNWMTPMKSTRDPKLQPSLAYPCEAGRNCQPCGSRPTEAAPGKLWKWVRPQHSATPRPARSPEILGPLSPSKFCHLLGEDLSPVSKKNCISPAVHELLDQTEASSTDIVFHHQVRHRSTSEKFPGIALVPFATRPSNNELTKARQPKKTQHATTNHYQLTFIS